ncbi:MAG TPA: hypothetical protein VJN02_01180 [Gammaproteobacteria bacterium]|nr:hypothetical protein [Gammaproteobacteria bacterium]
MINISYARFNFIRSILKLSIAVTIVIVIHHYLSFTNIYWLILATLLASLPTHGSKLRRGFIFFFILFVVIIGAQFFVIIDIHDRIVDIMLGVLTGILCQFIFPTNLTQEFRKEIISVLQSLATYLEALSTNFLSRNNREGLFEKKLVLEKFLSKRKIYPEWVFNAGFNPGLRAGFRFFLVHLDQVVELLFTLDYHLHRDLKEEINGTMRELMMKTMKTNHEIFILLIEYFKNNKFDNNQSDYTSDIVKLEKELWGILPSNLELLDLSEDFLILVAFVRNIKDTRRWLLKLLSALPDTTS